MKINPVIIAYLPRPNWECTQAFYRNVTSFATHYPILFYTADPDWKDKPNVHMLKAFPDVVRDSARYPTGQPNPWAVNNLCFWTGIGLAASKGYTHVIYLEVDCRIRGDGWDKIMFDEYMGAGEGKLMAGSVLCYSPCNGTREFTHRWRKFVVDHQSHQFAIPAYGGGGSAEKYEQIVMVNGALGIYDVAWLSSVAEGLNNTVEFSKRSTAWDYLLGRKLVEKYGASAFDYVVHLDSIYSGYKDAMFTEPERIALIDSEKVVGVHQVKSNWTILNGSVAEAEDARSAGTSARGSSDSDHNHRGAVAIPAGSNPAAAIPSYGDDVEPTLDRANPRVCIFIVTRAKDAQWLKYCLKSITKFASGFCEVKIVCPTKEMEVVSVVVHPYVVDGFDEAPAPLGHLHHEIIKTRADEYTNADYILHMDSDCLFTEPTTPQSFFVDGKPLILTKSWEKLEEEKQTALCWKQPTQEVLGFVAPFESMQRIPLVYHRSLYGAMRGYIEKKHDQEFDAFVLSRRPTFPYGYCEFVALGSYAHMAARDSYSWLDVGTHPHPHNPVLQMWSHGPMDAPQKVWRDGQLIEIVPSEEIKRVLGL